MSRLVLFALTVVLLNNEVKCGTLGKISKFEESLMPRASGTLPSNATQLNSELSSSKEVLVNASARRIGEEKNSLRKGKLFPNIAFVAGVNVGEFPAVSNPNLASAAKISEAKVSSPVFYPYVSTATFGPYSTVPAPNLAQQYIASMQLLLNQLHRQLDGANALPNSSHQNPEIIPYVSPIPPIPKDVDSDITDDRKRFNVKLRMDRLKIAKKAAEKRRMEQLEELEYDYEEEEVTHAPQQVPIKERTNPRQARPTMIGADNNATTMNKNITNTDNQPYPHHPGYFGGYPQHIGNIGLTYGVPQNVYPEIPSNLGSPATNYGLPSNTYGPPSNFYGPPSNTYGPPSNTYGPPSNNYGPPSNTYGLPSNSYGTPAYVNGQWPLIINGSPLYSNAHDHFTSGDNQPIFYKDFRFGDSLASSEPWQQYPPYPGNSQFARSRKFVSSTHSPPVLNGNGFVPI